MFSNKRFKLNCSNGSYKLSINENIVLSEAAMTAIHQCILKQIQDEKSKIKYEKDMAAAKLVAGPAPSLAQPASTTFVPPPKVIEEKSKEPVDLSPLKEVFNVRSANKEKIVATKTEDTFESAKASTDLNPGTFLIHQCPDCNNVFYGRIENLPTQCRCGSEISFTKKMWHRLKYKCPNCGTERSSFANDIITTVGCNGCKAPLDVKMKKGVLLAGELA